MRKIEALNLPDTTRATVTPDPPEIRMVRPDMLTVDETYQRNLSERSIRLIRKIVTEWNWQAFKPPIVVEVDGRLDLIDGQHTAIAAVTHGGISELPVLVIDASTLKDRASAFVRHNRDRLNVTPLQLHYALVAAGDEDALTIAQVCERAGIKILRTPPSMGRFRPCETLAVNTIKALINRRFAKGAREILEILAKAELAPVSARYIMAVEYLLHADEYRSKISATQISEILTANSSLLTKEAERYALEHKLGQWRALASVIFIRRRGRG